MMKFAAAMADSTAMELLLRAYRDEIAWLRSQAKEYGQNQAVAADYIHRANNLQTIINGYERLSAKSRAGGRSGAGKI
jgi:hypothetical protein